MRKTANPQQIISRHCSWGCRACGAEFVESCGSARGDTGTASRLRADLADPSSDLVRRRTLAAEHVGTVLRDIPTRSAISLLFTACLPGRQALDPIVEPFDNRFTNRFDRDYKRALPGMSRHLLHSRERHIKLAFRQGCELQTMTRSSGSPSASRGCFSGQWRVARSSGVKRRPRPPRRTCRPRAPAWSRGGQERQAQPVSPRQAS